MARPVDSDGISRLSVALDENSLADPVENLNDLRFIISIDYGTTYTGVAWILTTGEEPSLAKINVVRNWGVKISEKVPSTLTYSPNKGEQWGHGIGDSAYVIQRTKLELEVPSREHALDCLRKTLLEDQLLEDFSAPNLLRNGIPFHLIKSPSDIVTDYLTHVAKCVRRDIESQKDKAHLKQFPIDYVITHPAEWDPRAKNLTFRSVKAAFDRVFREAAKKKSSVHLVTEPEACAQYTRRDAKEGTGIMSDLVPGECFIVVDAGGGTVDLAAYQVEEAGENFQMSLATKVSGGRYGSTRIDDYFLKYFLSHKLPHEDLELIRGTGGENERHGSAAHVMLRRGEQFLLDQFIPLKHNFKGRDENGAPSATDWIDLPDGVGQLDDPDRNINQGQLGITCDDMERMFQLSVDGTIQLITHQLMQIHTSRLKVGAIFLSGGFSQSPYLFKRINSLAREYSITLLRGDDSWTAVAKGATLMALDMGCGRPPPPVMTSPCYVGVVLASSFAGFKHNLQQRYEDSFDGAIRAKNEIKWIVNKGDLVTHEEGVTKTIRTVRKLTPSGLKVGRVIIVTSQYEGRGEIPSNLDINNDPTRQEWNLDYDLAKIHKDSIYPWSQDYKSIKRKGKSFTRVEMELDISVTQGLLNTAVAARAELLWGRSKDFTGGLGAPGVQLAWLDIPSP